MSSKSIVLLGNIKKFKNHFYLLGHSKVRGGLDLLVGCGLWTPGLNWRSPSLLNVYNPVRMSAMCGDAGLLSLHLDGKM